MVSKCLFYKFELNFTKSLCDFSGMYKSSKIPAEETFINCYNRSKSRPTFSGFTKNIQNLNQIGQGLKDIRRHDMKFSNATVHFDLSTACVDIADTACLQFPFLLSPTINTSYQVTVEEDAVEISPKLPKEDTFESPPRLCSTCSNECVIMCLFLFTTMGLILLFYIVSKLF